MFILSATLIQDPRRTVRHIGVDSVLSESLLPMQDNYTRSEQTGTGGLVFQESKIGGTADDICSVRSRFHVVVQDKR